MTKKQLEQKVLDLEKRVEALEPNLRKEYITVDINKLNNATSTVRDWSKTYNYTVC